MLSLPLSLSPIGSRKRNATIPPWNRGRRPTNRKPGILRSQRNIIMTQPSSVERIRKRTFLIAFFALALLPLSSPHASAGTTILFTASTDYTGGFNTIAPNSNNAYIPSISPGVTLSPDPAYLNNQNVGPLDGISYGPSYTPGAWRRHRHHRLGHLDGDDSSDGAIPTHLGSGKCNQRCGSRCAGDSTTSDSEATHSFNSMPVYRWGSPGWGHTAPPAASRASALPVRMAPSHGLTSNHPPTPRTSLPCSTRYTPRVWATDTPPPAFTPPSSPPRRETSSISTRPS